MLRCLLVEREGDDVVIDNWIIPEDVKEPGYYWFGDSSELSLVMIAENGAYPGDKDRMLVMWPGDYRSEFLYEISGRFFGPIEKPKHWIE